MLEFGAPQLTVRVTPTPKSSGLITITTVDVTLRHEETLPQRLLGRYSSVFWPMTTARKRVRKAF